MPVQKRKLAPGNCAHCGIDETQTSLWRTGSNKEKLCNACGLYVQTHGRMRPLSVLGSRKKADSKKATVAASDEPKDGPSRPKDSKSSRHRSGSSSISSSVGSLAGGTSSSTSALPTPHALSLETRPSRSASISTSSTSLPSPTFSAQEGFPSPQFQPLGADSPPPSMSASLGKLDDVTMGGGPRPGTSVGTDELGAYVRARKGQKRHSISGGSSLGYPHEHKNPNHAVTKAPAANKKKARFELQQQHHQQQQQQRPLTVNTSSASYLATLSSSAPPTSSPISIPANMISSRSPSTVCLPCSKCAVLLPLRSSSVPLSEDPVCDRCLDAPGHGFTHQRALTSSSVPARTSSHLMMTSSLAQPPASSKHLTGWESEDEDYEFIDPPSQQLNVQMQRQPSRSKRAEQHHQQLQQQQQQQQHQQFPGTGSHTWSLEEEFSFLDTSFAIDSDPMLDTMEDVPPMPTLAGWGGPFFKNMPMPTGRKFHASAVQESSFPSPMIGGSSAAPPAVTHQHHRSFTSPTSSSSSSTSSLSSFSPVSGLPSPLTSGFTHDSASNSNGLPTPSASESNFNLNPSSSSSSKGLLLGLANLQPSHSRQQALPTFSSPHQAFAAAAQARLPIRPFLNGSLAEKAMNDGLEYLVNGPLSPIFPGGGTAMKRTGSARSGSSFRWDAGGEGEPMQVEMEEGLVSA